MVRPKLSGIRQTQTARLLRRNKTIAERHLWSRLRNGQISGAKFRRQHPVGYYIVDFICLEQGLVLEIDGNQHKEEPVVANDLERTRYLESRGYRVLRFWNGDILNNIEGVLKRITDALYDR
jgi:very-short-patch-repair endonuclease